MRVFHIMSKMILFSVASATLQSPASRFLSIVSDVFMHQVRSGFASDSSANIELLICGLRDMLHEAAESGVSTFETNQLINALDFSSNQAHEDQHIYFLLNFLPVPHVNLANHLSFIDAVIWRVLDIARRVGMSTKEAKKSLGFFMQMESSVALTRLDELDSNITEFIQHAPLRSSVPEDVRSRMGLDAAAFTTIECIADRMTYLHPMHRLLRDHGMSPIWSVLNEGSEELAPLVLGGLQIIADLAEGDFPPFKEHAEFLYGAALNTSSRDETVLHAAALVGDLSLLGQGLREREETLLQVLDLVATDARIVVVPKIVRIVKRACSIPAPDDRRALLEAIVHASVEVMTDPIKSALLVSLSSFMDRVGIDLWQILHSTDQGHEWNVLEFAFKIAQKFGVRLLVNFPGLLPGWSLNRIRAVRKIMGSFLQLDGPSIWSESELSSVLVNGSEDQLNRAVTILTVLYAKRTEKLETAPLINPGRWLREFLRSEPTPYSVWVHDLLLPRFLPQRVRANLFGNFDSLLENEYFKLPEKFTRLVDRLNSLSVVKECDRGNMKRALQLPGELLLHEINANVFYGSSNREIVDKIEEAATTLVDLIEEIARKGFDNVSAIQINSVSDSCGEIIRFCYLLDQLAERSDPDNINAALDALIRRDTQLALNIRQSYPDRESQNP